MSSTKSSVASGIGLPTLNEIEAEIARRKAERERGDAAQAARESFESFVRQAWHVIEPDHALLWNWHHEIICRALQAAAEGDPRALRLLINIPPGCSKSSIVSVMWPAWVWTWRPSWQGVFTSYDFTYVALRDSLATRDLILSTWYRETFRPDWHLTLNTQRRIQNSAGGERLCTTIGGSGTGIHGDAVVVDDPHNVNSRATDDEYQSVSNWWFKRMSNRLNNQSTGVLMVVGQRVDERDLSARIVRRGGYTHIRLPTEFEPDLACSTPWGDDPRTEAGELLFPELFPPEVIDEAKKDLDDAYPAQHQQRPAPRGGNKVKGWWLRFYYRRNSPPPPHVITGPDGAAHEVRQDRLPSRIGRVISSWDMPFKKSNRRSGKPVTSNVAGHVWGESGANMYLLDRRFGKMNYPEMKDSVRGVSEAWPQAEEHIIEDKAGGSALLDDLGEEVPAMVPFDPGLYGDKEVRLDMCLGRFRAGNIWLPHPMECPWVLEVVNALLNFPAWTQADDVDALTQAVLHLRAEMSDTSRLEALSKM